MKMDLQMFAEEEPENTEPETEETEESTEKEQPKMYTDAEVNEIVSKKLAEEKKKSEKAIADAKAEAEEEAKMSAEEKQKHEEEKTQQELEDAKARVAELEKAQEHANLTTQAQKIMKDEYDIIATPEMLDFVVGDDEDSTKANIKQFVAIINDDRKAQEKNRATGSTPKDYGSDKEKPTEIQKRIAKYKKGE